MTRKKNKCGLHISHESTHNELTGDNPLNSYCCENHRYNLVIRYGRLLYSSFGSGEPSCSAFDPEEQRPNHCSPLPAVQHHTRGALLVGHLVGLLLDPEDGGSALLRNVLECIPFYISQQIVLSVVTAVRISDPRANHLLVPPYNEMTGKALQTSALMILTVLMATIFIHLHLCRNYYI
jgi:hypothetical protein